MDLFIQLAIAFTGVTAIFLTNGSPRQRRWAPLFGLAGQPFWFITAYQAEQRGIFALCTLYAAAWSRGFYRNFIAKKEEPGTSHEVRSTQ